MISRKSVYTGLLFCIKKGSSLLLNLTCVQYEIFNKNLESLFTKNVY